jgi:hypothetical protein
MQAEKVLRVLTAPQQRQIDRLFNCLSYVAAKREGYPIILSRNKFVDSTIADLLDSVDGKEIVLVLAFAKWIWCRDFGDIIWHVTHFQRSSVGAIAAAEEELEIIASLLPKFQTDTKNCSEELQLTREAFKKFGGAQ